MRPCLGFLFGALSLVTASALPSNVTRRDALDEPANPGGYVLTPAQHTNRYAREVLQHGCREYILLWVRGYLEWGTMVTEPFVFASCCACPQDAF